MEWYAWLEPLPGRALALAGRRPAQFRRERELEMLLDRLDFLDAAESAGGEPVQHTGDPFLGAGGPAPQPARGHAIQPSLVDRRRVLDQIGRGRAGVQSDLDEAHRVRRVAGANHEDHV